MGGESRRFSLLLWRVGLARSIYVVSHARATGAVQNHTRTRTHAQRHTRTKTHTHTHTPFFSPKAARKAAWCSCGLLLAPTLRAHCFVSVCWSTQERKKVRARCCGSGHFAAECRNVEVPRHQMPRLTSSFVRCVCIDHGHPLQNWSLKFLTG